MIKKILLLSIAIFWVSSLFAGLKTELKGGKIIAEDGTFLGKIEGKYSSDSIFNQYGTYGSKYSSDSIFNQYGTYGSKYSDQSPFNQYTSNPPKIYNVEGKWIYLTANKSLSPRISVLELRAMFED